MNTAFGGGNRYFDDDLPITFNSAKEDRTHANNRTLDVRTRANNADELVGMRVHIGFCGQPIRFRNRAGEVCTCGRGSPVTLRAECR